MHGSLEASRELRVPEDLDLVYPAMDIEGPDDVAARVVERVPELAPAHTRERVDVRIGVTGARAVLVHRPVLALDVRDGKPLVVIPVLECSYIGGILHTVPPDNRFLEPAPAIETDDEMANPSRLDPGRTA